MLTLYSEDRPSRLRRFAYRLLKAAAILTSFTALGLVSFAVAMYLSMEPDKVEVPNVVGLDSVAAGALLREAGLTPHVAAEEFSSTIPKGHITQQRPPRGMRVKADSEVRLFVSRGTDRLAVPNVAGMDLSQAKQVLAEAGLTLGPITEIHSEVHARGLVIAQDPPEGAMAIRGETVHLLESVGPWEDMVTVPDLLGRETVTALNLLKELQLEVRMGFERAPSREGRVIAQDPPPGGQVKVGGQVRIVVGE